MSFQARGLTKRTAAVSFLVILIFVFPSRPSYGQAWSGILSPARATDWTYAGIPGGIPDGSWSNCVTTACNTVNGGTVTAASITSALSSAPVNTIVRVPAGSFSLSSTVYTNRSDVVLRGAGPTQTTFTCPSGTSCFYFSTLGTGGGGSYPVNLGSTNWTGGLVRGSTVLTLASTSGISAGENIVLDEHNPVWVLPDTGVEGACTSGNSCGRNDSPLQFWGGSTRAAPQMVHVISVNSGASQITIDNPGVAFDHASSLAPQAFFWNNGGNIQYVGIENMTLVQNGGSDPTVNLMFCDYCWVTNIAVNDETRTAVLFWWGFRDEVRDSYFSSNPQALGPTEYGIDVRAASSSKIENNIFFNITSPVLLESSYGTVVGYNYMQNTIAGAVFGSIETHLSHNFMQLYEGNVAQMVNWDNSWGSGSHNTAFRNQLLGNGPNKNSYREALKVDASNYYMNVVANVLGDLSLHTQYTCDLSHLLSHDDYEYGLGFWDDCANGSSNFDSLAESSLMRWGNWDAVTYIANGNKNGIRYCTANGAGNSVCTSSETASTDPTFPGLSNPNTIFPPSFYTGIASEYGSCGTGLSFWKNPANGYCPPYPPIGPEVSCTKNCNANTANHAAMIPAQMCYGNTPKDGNGFLTAFDAKACYVNDTGTGAGSSPPAPPSGLTATVE